MTAEETLRRLLQEHAADVQPRGDGLAVIRRRVAASSWRTSRWLPVGAAAAALAVVAVVAVVVGTTPGGGTRPSLTQTGAPATVPPSDGPTPSQGTQTTAPPATTTTTSAPGLPVWPVTTDAQAEAWRADPQRRPWGGDPAQVAVHFATDFLHLPGLTAGSTSQDAGSASVVLIAVDHPAARVHLVRVGGHPDSPWAVTGSAGGQLVITSPPDEQAVTSPLEVRGTVVGVDESIRTALITASGQQLDLTHTPAGSALPWHTALSWRDQGWSVAALVAVTFSAKDGSPTAVTMVAVSRSGG